MPSPLEDIRFLADSENRFTALDALAGGPRTRSELRTETAASAATISRLLGDFEDRGWVARNGRQYELTPLGEYVATTLVEAHQRMTTASKLGDLLPWFPLEAVDVEFDLEVLTGAAITAATPENPMAPVARVLEIERESSWTNTLADRFPEECTAARHEAVVEGSQTMELVTTADAVQSVLSSESADAFAEIVAAEDAAVYVHDGEIPPGGIHDGTAYLIVADDRDVNIGVIESDDPEIVDRVTATFEEYRADASQLSRSMLEHDPASIRTEP